MPARLSHRLSQRLNDKPIGAIGNGWRDFSEDCGRDSDCVEQRWQQLQLAYRAESNKRTGVRDRRHSKRLAGIDLSTEFIAVKLEIGDPSL